MDELDRIETEIAEVHQALLESLEAFNKMGPALPFALERKVRVIVHTIEELYREIDENLDDLESEKMAWLISQLNANCQLQARNVEELRAMMR